MAEQPPDPKRDKTADSGCKEKTSRRAASRGDGSNDGPDCECMLCERRRERDLRNQMRQHGDSASLSNSATNLQRMDSPLPRRPDLRRSLLDRTSVLKELNDSKCQSCPDLICVGDEVEDVVTDGTSDDMEGYFNANRHMLIDEDDEEECRRDAAVDTGQISCSNSRSRNTPAASIPVETHTYHFPPEVMHRGASNNDCDNEDIDEGGVFVCEDDKIVINCTPQTQVGDNTSSSSDQGDFIEADIPRNAYKGGLYACSSSNNSPDSSSDSSYEDLRTMSLERQNNGERRSHDDDHSYEDLRLLDIRPPNRSGMNALSHAGDSASGNALSASNVRGDESCRPKTLYGESLQIGGCAGADAASPVTSMSESSHRTPSSSFLSPQLSDSGATYGIASESSVFMSPDGESFEPLSRPPLLRHRSVDCNEHCSGEASGMSVPFRAVRSSNDLPHAAAQEEFASAYTRPVGGSGGLDIQNMDSHSYKAHHAKEKHINWKASNREDHIRGGGGPSSHLPRNGGGGHGEHRDRSASDASSKKSGRWTCKIVRTGKSYQPNPERYTKPMVCSSVYEAWAETRVRNLFYSEHHAMKRETSSASKSSSEEDLLVNINNLNRRRTESSDYEELCNVSRQTSTSNFEQDENSFQQLDLSGVRAADHRRSGGVHLCNVDGETADHNTEEQENENNINLETGELQQQQQQQQSEQHRSDPDQLQKTYNDIKQTILKRKKYKKRTKTIYVKGKPTRHKLIKFKMRPGQIFQALDYDYIHFNYSDSEQTSSSSDSDTEDGYVDFQVLLRNYMIQRLHERHSLSLLQHQEEVRLAREMEKVMIWSEYEAYMSHIRQIGASACGATAAINVLKALDIKVDQDRMCEQIRTNVRKEKGNLTEYILSRAVAGTTARQLIEAVERYTKGGVRARFFHMYPARDIPDSGCLRKWLAMWMKKGAVPVVTLNRQRAVPPGYAMPDAWHHQMVFGAGPKGIYLTNPQEIIPEHVLLEQLCSEGMLKVRRKDVVSRWRPDTGCPLANILLQKDPRWATYNVVGQLVHVLREEFGGAGRQQLTSHVTIPAWYKSGITLYVRSTNANAATTNSVYADLMAAEDFPLKTHAKHTHV